MLAAAITATLLGCAGTPTAQISPHAPSPAAPRAASHAKSPDTARTPSRAEPRYTRHAIATANPLATEAGLRMLDTGGSALDAAIAAQMVLTLVEPQASGIGGGALLLHWDGRALDAWDGRETAPAGATESLFLNPDGQPMSFEAAVAGGRAVGVPGALRMLEAAHRRHGRLPWAELFAPAIELAERGFPVSPRFHAQLSDETLLRADQQARAYFFSEVGQPHPVGHRLTNPALALVLRGLAREGADALHRGPIAADLARRVRGHPNNPGTLDEQDLANYRPLRRDALCTDWLARYRVCGFPPPSSGHLAIMQTLGMLESLPDPTIGEFGVPDVDWLHRYLEASRLAFADRARYVADPAFVAAPAGDWRSLLAPEYLRTRARRIGERAMTDAPAGSPGSIPLAYASQPEQPETGTSHLSVVDGHGNALAMTSTIESIWGARMMSDGGTGLRGGFVLNNELTDFSFRPADATGTPIANRVQPGKRPRSSMSPTLVFDRRDGHLLMSLGSPGGAAIIHFTAKTLVAIGQAGLSPQTAIDAPNVVRFGASILLEAGRMPDAVGEALRRRGHLVNAVPLTSGVQAVVREPGAWVGGADRRREGAVGGR